MSTAVTEYVNRIANASPQEAVQIALAESERQTALAEQERVQYKALAEVEFDDCGRIARANMAGLYRMAQAYAGSQIIPDHYRGKPNDCFIACQMALNLKVPPLAYMQNSYIVHGKPGLESKLGTALLNTSGKIVGRVRYREDRDAKSNKMLACTAFCKDAETGDEVSATVTWAMVEAEGWNKKAGSKWLTMPELMFHYRSAAFLIRTYYPEVTMGMHTVDELEDIQETKPARTLTELNAAIAQVGHANGNQKPESGSTDELPSPSTPFCEPTETEANETAKRDAFADEVRRRLTEAKTDMELNGVIQDIDAREDWLGPFLAGSLRDEYRAEVDRRQDAPAKGKKR